MKIIRRFLDVLSGSRSFLSPRLYIPMAFLLPGIAFSQNLSDGSIYSRFGLGQRTMYSSARAVAMGGGGFGLASTRYTNFANPAGLGDLFFTRLSGGFTYQATKESATDAESSSLAAGYVSAIQFSFPIKSNKIGFGLSFSPFTRVSYRVVETGSLNSSEPGLSEQSFTTSFKGNGGLQRVSAGIGVVATNHLSLGIRGDLYLGILRDSQRTGFRNTRFTDALVSRSTRLAGASATVGLRFSNRGIVGKNDALSLGVVLTLPARIIGDRILTVGEGENIDTLGTTQSGSVNLPLGFSAGISYKPTPKWTIVADMLYEKWTDFKSDFDFPGYTAGSGGGLDDRIRISGGIEFFPGAANLFAGYFEKMSFRLGVYTDRSYASPLPSERIDSFGITGGLAIPTLVPGTSIDLNLDVGRQGTTSNGLIRDRYVRFGLNLNFGERWFTQRKLR
jgi:hypothetical protein